MPKRILNNRVNPKIIPAGALSLATKICSIGKSAYIVGSFNVRAILQMRFDDSSDIDFATSATGSEVRGILEIVSEIGLKYWTLIVRECGQTYEITTFRRELSYIDKRRPSGVIFTDSLQEDASRRDFTMNAIYLDPISGRFEDPVWGISDISKRIIRFVGNAEERINEDPLRLLRYVRIKSEYGFKPAVSDYDTFIKKRMSSILSISQYRVLSEIERVFGVTETSKAIEELYNLGLFATLFPEIAAAISAKPSILSIISKAVEMTQWHTSIQWAIISIWSGTNVESAILSKLPFSKRERNKIIKLAEFYEKFELFGSMEKIKQVRYVIAPLFEELIVLWNAFWKFEKVREWLDFRKTVKEKLDKVVLWNGNSILKKYPELQWSEISRRIELENDRIFETF